jgi:hypothetical protein
MNDLAKHIAYHFIRIFSAAGNNFADIWDDIKAIFFLFYNVLKNFGTAVAGTIGFIIGVIILPVPYIFSSKFRKNIKTRNDNRESLQNENCS